jgi:hypothetical protein
LIIAQLVAVTVIPGAWHRSMSFWGARGPDAPREVMPIAGLDFRQA